jgi:hypothetical protein
VIGVRHFTQYCQCVQRRVSCSLTRRWPHAARIGPNVKRPEPDRRRCHGPGVSPVVTSAGFTKLSSRAHVPQVTDVADRMKTAPEVDRYLKALRRALSPLGGIRLGRKHPRT